MRKMCERALSALGEHLAHMYTHAFNENVFIYTCGGGRRLPFASVKNAACVCLGARVFSQTVLTFSEHPNVGEPKKFLFRIMNHILTNIITQNRIRPLRACVRVGVRANRIRPGMSLFLMPSHYMVLRKVYAGVCVCSFCGHFIYHEFRLLAPLCARVYKFSDGIWEIYRVKNSPANKITIDKISLCFTSQIRKKWSVKISAQVILDYLTLQTSSVRRHQL